VIELNRRLILGYERYKDDERIQRLQTNVMAYNKTLLQLNIRDHQVENATLPVFKVLGLIIYRLGKLALLAVAVIPGLFLFSPVFIAGKIISIKKSREALAASSVKIQARDVMATWKLLVSLILAPALYILYDIVLGYLTYKNRLYGIIPYWAPVWLILILGFAAFGGLTYAALRFGEIGMDIVKSLRPLFIALAPHHGNTLQNLRERRYQLAQEVTELINELGPEMFPDFQQKRIIPAVGTPADTPTGHESEYYSEPNTPTTPSYNSSNSYLPRNESLHDLSNVGVFASRPTTPYHHRSRSRSESIGGGALLKGFSPLELKDNVDELSKKIRGEVRQRVIRRNSSGWESDSSGSGVSGSHMDGLSMTKDTDA
jgi:glycerol-3-phosphate O-acyltransferase/dihydroxyacetone phosphate acyltransferase